MKKQLKYYDKTGAYAIAPKSLFDDLESLQAVAVWVYLRCHTEDYNFAVDRIARALNITEKTARKYVRELEQAGLLIRVNNPGQPSDYVLFPNRESRDEWEEKHPVKIPPVKNPGVNITGGKKAGGKKSRGKKSRANVLLSIHNTKKDLIENLPRDDDNARELTKFFAREVINNWKELSGAGPGTVAPVLKWQPHHTGQFFELCREYNPEDPIALLDQFFENLKNSPFLLGAAPSNGQTTFRTRFSWVLRRENFEKVVEGHYLAENRLEVSKKRREDFNRETEKEREKQIRRQAEEEFINQIETKK